LSRHDAPAQRKFLYILNATCVFFQMLQLCVHFAMNTRTRCCNDSWLCANVASVLQMLSRSITNGILPSCICVLTFIWGFCCILFFVAYAFTKCCHDLLDVFNPPWKKHATACQPHIQELIKGGPFCHKNDFFFAKLVHGRIF
jgi:hypothetical protein